LRRKRSGSSLIARIIDQEGWSAYVKLAAPAVQKADGKFLVGGMPAMTREKAQNPA